MRPAALAHQWVAFSISTPMQEAVARALDAARQPFEGHASYYTWLLSEYTRKREILAAGLRAAGLVPLETQGSFFIMADTSSIEVPERFLYPNGRDAAPAPRDYAFCRFLTTEIGVAAIPPSAFRCDAIAGAGSEELTRRPPLLRLALSDSPRGILAASPRGRSSQAAARLTATRSVQPCGNAARNVRISTALSPLLGAREPAHPGARRALKACSGPWAGTVLGRSLFCETSDKATGEA